MPEMLFDIFITGKLVNGVNPEIAQDDFARLFKTTPDKVSRYFTGEPQLFKRAIDKTEALRYKEALHKAGVLVSFMAHKPAAAASSDQTAPLTVGAPAKSATPSEDRQDRKEMAKSARDADEKPFTLAPVGSDVLRQEERHEFVPVNINTSQIKMVSAFFDLEPEEKIAPPPPDTTHLTIAPPGEDLLLDKPQRPPPLELDLESLTLAPPGSPLDKIHENITPVDPDISALSLAPLGADILEGQEKPVPPPAPDTSHISI